MVIGIVRPMEDATRITYKELIIGGGGLQPYQLLTQVGTSCWECGRY
jgi:hypothetical protein